MNRQEEHRDDELLLRLADGELEAKEADLAQAHLKACWRCRMRFEDLQSSIADYMRYREGVMKPLLPPPPQPWGSLRGQLRKVDTELAPPRHWRIPHVSPRWLATAAAAVLIVVAANRFWREPVVSAAEILRKASAAEASPSARRRIQIKTRARTIVRARSMRSKSLASLDGTAELQALFAAANFSWEEPLSARSFEAWHEQLSDKVDTVSIVADRTGGGRLYEIRTATAASSLTDAELTVRAADWQPVHEVLQFGAGERVEISELDDAPADLAPPVSMAASQPVPTTSAERVVVPDHTASAGDELRVIAALHRIGADLGEPIEVTRSKGGGIQVAGSGLDAARKEQLRALLASLPGVTVRFDDAQTIPAGKEDQRRESRSSTAPVSMLQLQLQSYLGSAAALQKFTDGILDVSDGAMARAHALRNLAERFPQSEEQTLSTTDRGLLITLRREHASALKEFAQRMAQLVQPVLAIPEQTQRAAPNADSWQDRTRNVLESTRQVDRLLNQMLAGGDSSQARQHTPQELATALASLQTYLAADETR
jgi:hypothetical protein